MKLTVFTLITGLILASSQALAQDNDVLNALQQEAEELQIQPESQIDTDIPSLPGEACQSWIAERRWEQGKNVKNGRPFFVQIGAASVSAPPEHPNYITSRQNAYVKAFMKAKGNLAEFMKTEVARDITLAAKEGEFSSTQAEKKEGEFSSTQAEKPESAGLQEIKRKTLALINRLLDKKLQEEGVNPSTNPETVQQAKQQVIQQVIESEKFKDETTAHALHQLKGVRRIYVKESAKKGEQASLCVVALTSPVTTSMADAVFSDAALAPVGEPDKPIAQQIDWKTAAGKAKLVSTFGTEMRRDEHGQFHLIAYAQSAPKTRSQRSLANAVQKAKQRAFATLRTFAQEQVALNAAQENSELARTLDNGLQDQDNEYESNNAFAKEIKSVSGPSSISGASELGRWIYKHPVTGHLIVGSIIHWSPDNARAAKEQTAHMNAPARAVNRSSASNKTHFRNNALQSATDYHGSASGGSSDEDF